MDSFVSSSSAVARTFGVNRPESRDTLEMEARIVVLGSDATLCHRFADHLGVEDVVEGRWTIDNEYYVAETRVILKHAGEPPSDVSGAQAIVLLFEEEKEGSFDVIKQLYESLEGTEGLSVRLCVCHARVGSSRELPTELDWCVDAGFELIFAAVGEKERDTQLFHEDDGCSGVERAKIALSCELWPGMQRKDRKDSVPSSKEEEFEENAATTSLPAEFDPIESLESEGDEKEENFLRDMEDIIRTIRSVRSAGKDKNDEERRKEAEEVVHRMMSLMGYDPEDV